MKDFAQFANLEEKLEGRCPSDPGKGARSLATQMGAIEVERV